MKQVHSFWIVMTIAAIALLAGLAGCKSPELLNSMSREKPVVVDGNLQSPGTLRVVTGYRDSVFLRAFDNKSQPQSTKYPNLSALALREKYPTLDERAIQDSVIKYTKEHTQQFTLAWVPASGVTRYEIRASHEPITTENWDDALPVTHTVISSDGIVVATIPLTKSSVYPGKCVNCGECVKACKRFNAISTINGKSVVDPNKCTSCGECWTSCKYNALDGLFAGQSYFFAVRSVGVDGTVSPGISTVDQPYMVRYMTMGSIPDSMKTAALKWPAKPNGETIDFKKGCFGNCGITVDTATGLCESGCYIVHPISQSYFDGTQNSVCPVSAIKTFENADDAKAKNSLQNAIYIDTATCINCGKCMIQCQYEGFGSVTTETVLSWEKLLKR